MHRCARPENLPSVRLADALVPQAHAEDGDCGADLPHDLGGNAGFLWRAGPG
jgi:hypothetical protein